MGRVRGEREREKRENVRSHTSKPRPGRQQRKGRIARPRIARPKVFIKRPQTLKRNPPRLIPTPQNGERPDLTKLRGLKTPSQGAGIRKKTKEELGGREKEEQRVQKEREDEQQRRQREQARIAHSKVQEAKKANAATRIQSIHRGRIGRKKSVSMRMAKEVKDLSLKHRKRRGQLSAVLGTLSDNALKQIQSTYRCFDILTRDVRELKRKAQGASNRVNVRKIIVDLNAATERASAISLSVNTAADALRDLLRHEHASRQEVAKLAKDVAQAAKRAKEQGAGKKEGTVEGKKKEGKMEGTGESQREEGKEPLQEKDMKKEGGGGEKKEGEDVAE